MTICRIQSRICIGGPAHHSVVLSTLLSLQYRTILIGGSLEAGEREMTSEAEARGIETRILGSMRRWPGHLGDLVALVSLWLLLRRERPVIVHTHTAKAGVLGRIAARLAGVPVVVHTFHGHVFEGYFPPWVSGAMILLERLLARLSDAIIVLSPAQNDDIVRRFRIVAAHRVHTIPLGLDLERFAALAAAPQQSAGALRRELRCGPETLLVGIVGRLVPVKNHELFLEAAARLFDDLPERELRFVIVGDGERRAAIDAHARRLGLASRVHLLGWRLDLAPLLADLDLLASTSRNEGTPAALIEAMAAGVPVVATAVGGVEDVLRGYPAGTVVASFEPADLAVAMRERLLNPGVRASHGAERFGAGRLARDMEALYARLLRAKGIEPPPAGVGSEEAAGTGDALASAA